MSYRRTSLFRGKRCRSIRRNEHVRRVLRLTANKEAVKGESSVSTIGGEDVSTLIECDSYTESCRTAQEAGSMTPTGTRLYEPIVIRKNVDSSSPLIMRALTDTEPCEAEFLFFRPTKASGKQEKFFTITLARSARVSVERFLPDEATPPAVPRWTSAPRARPPQEMVSFVFGKIELRSMKSEDRARRHREPSGRVPVQDSAERAYVLGNSGIAEYPSGYREARYSSGSSPPARSLLSIHPGPGTRAALEGMCCARVLQSLGTGPRQGRFPLAAIIAHLSDLLNSIRVTLVRCRSSACSTSTTSCTTCPTRYATCSSRSARRSSSTSHRLQNVSVRLVPTKDPLTLQFEILARLASDRQSLVRMRTRVRPGGQFHLE